MVWFPIGLAGLLNILTWIVLLVNITPQNELIVLHYSVYFGVDRVGTWYETLWIPIFGVLLFIINTGFSFFFIDKHKIVSKFFLYLSPFYQLLLLFVAIFIVLANAPATI